MQARLERSRRGTAAARARARQQTRRAAAPGEPQGRGRSRPAAQPAAAQPAGRRPATAAAGTRPRRRTAGDARRRRRRRRGRRSGASRRAARTRRPTAGARRGRTATTRAGRRRTRPAAATPRRGDRGERRPARAACRSPIAKSRETRGRRPAVRERHRRRGRTARPARRGAPVEARRGGGADHLRPRLRHVAERAAAGPGRGERPHRSGASRSATRASEERFGRLSARVFQQTHSLGRRARVARRGGADQPGADPRTSGAQPATRSTSSCSGASATTRRTTARARCPDKAVARADGRARAGDRACRSSGRCSRGVRGADVPDARRARPRRGGVGERRRCPAIVVGSGSEIPARVERRALPAEVRRSPAPFAIYVGRIDGTRAATSCSSSTGATRGASANPLPLVLCGNSILPIPDDPARPAPRLRLRRRTSSTAIAAASLLVMPSYYESLSIVALEAWALGRAGAGQRAVRRAEGTVPAQQRGAVLRELRRVRRGAGVVRPAARSWRAALGENGCAYFQAPLRVAGRRAAVPRPARAAVARAAGRRGGPLAEPLPGLVGAAEAGARPAGRVRAASRFPRGPSRRP